MPEKLSTTENVEEKKSPESELSPEVLEKVMSKVQDINGEGTAFTLVSPVYLTRILQEGILSGGGWTRDLKEWALRTKKIRQRVKEEGGYGYTNTSFDDWERMGVFINIVGRKDRGWSQKPTKIGEGLPERERSLGLLLDLAQYKEIPPFAFYFETKPMEARTYKGTNVIDYEDWKRAFGDRPKEEYEKVTWDDLKEKMPWLFDKKGRPLIHSTAHGFYVGYNIPPKFIQGVVKGFKIPQSETVQSMMKAHENKKGKTDVLLPLYNHRGDLLWPKYMSYEEVKKFVAERDKNKDLR